MYFDICPYKIFDINNEDAEKHQIIIYKIEDLTHKPLVSFCLEDLCSGDTTSEVEIYIEGTTVNNHGIQVYISIPNSPVLIFQNNELFYFIDDTQKINIKRSKFNNYNYIEKTIIDEVEDHQNILKQVVAEVKRITDHLSQ